MVFTYISLMIMEADHLFLFISYLEIFFWEVSAQVFYYYFLNWDI